MINRGRSARSAAFAAFAVLTFAGSRVMLAGRPEGLLAWVYVVVIVVLAAGFVAAAQGESFRAGLVNGYVVLVAGWPPSSPSPRPRRSPGTTGPAS